MDLYGQGVSIGQANSQIQSVQNANVMAREFNDSLAGQLDEARTMDDADANSKQQINMISGATAGGKLLTSAKAREDLLGKGLKGSKKGATGFRELKVSTKELEEAKAGKEAGAGEDLAEGIRAVYRGGARPVSPTGLSRGGAVVGTSEEARSVAGAGEEGARLVGAGREGANALGVVESSLDAGGKVGAKLGLKVGAEIGAKAVGKVALAGVGGGLDIARDIERGKGLFDKDTYGSNNMQRVGNIGNIIGSGLEVAGLLTAWTPFGVGLEGLGALVSVGSTALETAGDIEESGEKADKTTEDITSQARGEAVTQQVTTAIGRSN